ncbi:MAG TPA: ComF family protein [Armatimonadota bacterium]|nr:ComF family protein [Armatimonadota bacterium]
MEGASASVHWLTKGFLDLLFPPRCLACRRFGPEPLCADCGAAVEYVAPPLCHRCGIPFDPQARGGPLCASCRRGRLPYVMGRSVARYQGPLRQAVHRLKYDGKRVLAGVLGELMAAALLDGGDGSAQDGVPAPPRIPFDRLSLIVPVPLHPVRARERGFNQAELLCGPLARRAGAPIAIHCLQRVKLNPPQVAVPAKLRRANVRGAFAVTDAAAVDGRTVLVFDDVWTTGATLVECARMLRRAGAAEVYLLSLCRATGYREHPPPAGSYP